MPLAEELELLRDNVRRLAQERIAPPRRTTLQSETPAWPKCQVFCGDAASGPGFDQAWSVAIRPSSTITEP